MKIKQEDTHTTLELESPEGFATFRAGMQDQRNWVRHPETIELNKFMQDNSKTAQVFVQYGDTYTKLR